LVFRGLGTKLLNLQSHNFEVFFGELSIIEYYHETVLMLFVV
jgi:hypothetical protein